VVIDIANDHVAALEARTGTGFTSTITRASLPNEIRSGTHVLTRDDLAGF
jgi:hypothetical protein